MYPLYWSPRRRLWVREADSARLALGAGRCAYSWRDAGRVAVDERPTKAKRCAGACCSTNEITGLILSAGCFGLLALPSHTVLPALAHVAAFTAVVYVGLCVCAVGACRGDAQLLPFRAPCPTSWGVTSSFRSLAGIGPLPSPESAM
jgi:hypothetical protein